MYSESAQLVLELETALAKHEPKIYCMTPPNPGELVICMCKKSECIRLVNKAGFVLPFLYEADASELQTKS